MIDPKIAFLPILNAPPPKPPLAPRIELIADWASRIADRAVGRRCDGRAVDRGGRGVQLPRADRAGDGQQIGGRIAEAGSEGRHAAAGQSGEQELHAELVGGRIRHFSDDRFDQHLLAPRIELPHHLIQLALHLRRRGDDDRIGSSEASDDRCSAAPLGNDRGLAGPPPAAGADCCCRGGSALLLLFCPFAAVPPKFERDRVLVLFDVG